jgi:hypothetical protein
VYYCVCRVEDEEMNIEKEEREMMMRLKMERLTHGHNIIQAAEELNLKRDDIQPCSSYNGS